MDLVMNRGAMKSAVLLTVLTLLAGCAEKPTAPLDAESGAPVLAANGNGNSGSGKRCQHGGWTRLVTSTGTGFANQGDCVSYSAAGGIVYQTQTLSFAPLADKTFGDPDFTVSATASSGLTVSFSASGSCTVSGTTVHLTGAGSCTITASQAGDAVWYQATDLARTFAVGKGDQTITFGALADKLLGDPLFDVSATASSGLAVSFSASGTCTISGSTVRLAAAGSCTITASQAGDADWNSATDVAQTFTIVEPS